MINKNFLGVFSKKIDELSKKGKVKIAFGLSAPDPEIETSLKSVVEYADITFVGPEAIKDIKSFSVVVDPEPEKKIASMLANNEVEGIIRGTIDDFKTAEAYQKATGEVLDRNPGLIESINGFQFFLSPGSNPEGWEKEERLGIALDIAKFAKEWGVEPNIAYFTGVRHETYKRKKEIKDGVAGVLNKTYEDAEWLVEETNKAGYKCKNWAIDLDLAIQDGANIIVPANGMIGNQIFRAILLSGGRVLAGPRISCSRAYEDNSRNEKDFTFHIKWINAWINSKK